MQICWQWHESEMVKTAVSSSLNTLKPTQYGSHFPDDIFKCIFWMKIYEFRLRFHWNVSLRVQLTLFQHWINWLVTDQSTIHYLNQWWLDYWCINTPFDLNELTDESIYHNGIYTITPDSLKCFEESMHMRHSWIARIGVNKCHWWPRWDDVKMKFYSWFRRETIFVSRLLFNYMSCQDDLSHENVKTCKRFPHCWRFMRRIYRSQTDSPKKDPVMRSFHVFSLGQAIDQTLELPVIWDSMTSLWCTCNRFVSTTGMNSLVDFNSSSDFR